MKKLDSLLTVSSRGNACPDYRATIDRGTLGAIIYIEQPINDKWQRCGGWYLSTLLEGGVSDSLYIDFGQGWKIDSGLVNLVDEACLYLAKKFDKGESK